MKNKNIYLSPHLVELYVCYTTDSKQSRMNDISPIILYMQLYFVQIGIVLIIRNAKNGSPKIRN